MADRKRPANAAGEPHDVRAIRDRLEEVLDLRDEEGRIVSKAKCGVYAFFDYDGEPIYVGQTDEQLRVRILRHLTNQRTDAVAMNVLDPFEVMDVAMWPFFELDAVPDKKERRRVLDAAEYAAYAALIEASAFRAILNEKEVTRTELSVTLPRPVRATIIPEDILERRRHKDVRIARRAQTIANLARVISERTVQQGLRRTLLTQARRLEHLANSRLLELEGQPPLEIEEDLFGEIG